MNRRAFLTGLIAAPAIVRPHVLMPISVWREPITWVSLSCDDGCVRVFRSDVFECMPGWVLDQVIAGRELPRTNPVDPIDGPAPFCA